VEVTPVKVKKYGQTGEEKHSEEMIQARQIVATVLDFGVTQQQIVRIVKLLGLELENHDHMLRISDAAQWAEDDVDSSSIIT